AMVQSFIPEAVLVEEGSTEEVSNETEQVDQEGNQDQVEEQSGENTRPSKKEKELLKEAEKKAKKNKDQDHRVGKTVKTTVSYSNVRSGPGLDYSIVTSVSKGSRVFIYEAEGEDERTWYHGIITSSETGNSYDAWISSKNLE
ncbi:MAG: SH3 domain-containing protein, partial [Tissierellia bacterium]|nr:SH3 domain-containing protein [Tissierellia bacterium]